MRYLFLLLMVLFAGSSSFSQSKKLKGKRPHIVLMMADDQGYGDASSYGHPFFKSPALDQLAKDGIQFKNYYAASPVCTPTRASVLTGRHPNRFSCFHAGGSLRSQEVTLPEMLQANGYKTFHVGKWHLGSLAPNSPEAPKNNGFDEWCTSPNYYDNDPYLLEGDQVIKEEGEGSMITVKKALNFIKRNKEQPTFTVIWFGSPHDPYASHTAESLEEFKDYPKKVQGFYSEMRNLDNAVAYFRDELKKMGISDDTFLWYSSDNGPVKVTKEQTGGLTGKKNTLWEAGVRVPSYVVWPKYIKPNQVSKANICSTDVYPTLLHLAGVKLKETNPVLDGKDVSEYFLNIDKEREEKMFFWAYPQSTKLSHSDKILLALKTELESGAFDGDLDVPESKIKKTVDESKFNTKYSFVLDGHFKFLSRIDDKGRDDYQKPAKAKKPKLTKAQKQKLKGLKGKERKKYLKSLRKQGPKAKAQYKEALFDLSKDIQENNDVSAQYPEKVKELKQALLEWKQSVKASSEGNDY